MYSNEVHAVFKVPRAWIVSSLIVREFYACQHYQKCETFRACITIPSRDRESGPEKEILAEKAISYNLDVNLYLRYSQKGS